MFNEGIYSNSLKGLNAAIPYKKAEYFNMCLASMIADGDKITSDRIMKMLIVNAEMHLIDYAQALFLNDEYLKYFEL